MTDPHIRRAAEQIHDALDAADEGFHDRATGVVDATSDELAAALLRAGWTPPTDAEETQLCGSWPKGWYEGEAVSCILPRGHDDDTCRSRFGGQWRRCPERTPS